jgi:hypothetical protein
MVLGLPKALRDALEQLASEKEIGQLKQIITEQLQRLSPDLEQEPILDIEHNFFNINWSEGVEEFQALSFQELWEMLGIPGKAIPFFNRSQDPCGNHDPWDETHRDWFKDQANTEPLQPRWHQLVGILKMVHSAFKGDSILLMDEVGLGKTLQIVGLVAVLAFYRDYYTQFNRFPGAFGKKWVMFSPSMLTFFSEFTVA